MHQNYLSFFFSSRRRHTISLCDWSSDVCSSDLPHRLHHPPGSHCAVARREECGPGGDGSRELWPLPPDPGELAGGRSEERRVGKECRSRGSPCQYKRREAERDTSEVVGVWCRAG